MAGVYSTLTRPYVYTFHGVCFFSMIITTSISLTSENDLAANMPPATQITDLVLCKGSNLGTYGALINTAGRLRPNGSLPAGIYFINGVYRTSDL